MATPILPFVLIAALALASGSGGGKKKDTPPVVKPPDGDLTCGIAIGSTVIPTDEDVESLAATYYTPKPIAEEPAYVPAYGAELFADTEGLPRLFARSAVAAAVLTLDDKGRAEWQDQGKCWAPGGPPQGMDRVTWATLQVVRQTLNAIAFVTDADNRPAAAVYRAAAKSLYQGWTGRSLAIAMLSYSRADWQKLDPLGYGPDDQETPEVATGVELAPWLKVILYNGTRKLMQDTLA